MAYCQRQNALSWEVIHADARFFRVLRDAANYGKVFNAQHKSSGTAAECKLHQRIGIVPEVEAAKLSAGLLCIVSEQPFC